MIPTSQKRTHSTGESGSDSEALTPGVDVSCVICVSADGTRRMTRFWSMQREEGVLGQRIGVNRDMTSVDMRKAIPGRES